MMLGGKGFVEVESSLIKLRVPEFYNKVNTLVFNRLHSVILMLECLIFGMFVLAILIDQLSAIFTDETAVEHVSFEHDISA